MTRAARHLRRLIERRDYLAARHAVQGDAMPAPVADELDAVTWAIDQLADLFRDEHAVAVAHVVEHRRGGGS